MKRLHINSQIHGLRFIDFNNQEELDQYLSQIGNHWGDEEQVNFSQEDLSQQLNQEQINKEALEYLASTDYLIIREMDNGVPCPAEVKAARQAARERIVK